MSTDPSAIEDGPEDQRADDPVEEDTVLVLKRNAEVGEDQHEDKDIVDGE